MEKKYVLLTLFVFVFLLTNIFDGVGFCLRVIPNAPWQHGFGIDTSAGSGRHLATPSTNVYKVTNLNDSGPGSLRYGLEDQASPKVIVFEVSGNIALSSNIVIGGFLAADAETKGSYITIAGQTAPSPGITLKDYGLIIERKCHDILIQHIRVRPGDTAMYEGIPKASIPYPIRLYESYNPADGTVPPYDVVIDHCSFSWGADINIFTGANDITFCNCISSEALNHPLHPKGPHSKGWATIAYNDGVSGGKNNAIINNLLAHNADRNPLIHAGSAVVANNLIYKHHTTGIIINDGSNAAGGSIQASLIGNYIIDTGSGTAIYLVMGAHTGSLIYLASDNYFYGQVQTDPWNHGPDRSWWERQYLGEPYSDIPEANKVSSPPVWPTDGYTTMPVLSVKDYVLSHVGARPADRDSVDVRIVNDVKNGTGGIIASQDDVGGWPNLAQNTSTLTVPSNPNEIQPSGYTKLEEWLHEFSRTVEGKPGRPGKLTF